MRNKIGFYLQLTLNVTVVSSRCPSVMALFQTAQRYFIPSSSLRGTNDNVLVVGKSFDPPLFNVVSIGVVLPSRYQLTNVFDCIDRICDKKNTYTYTICGSGEPPILLHVKSSFLFSVAAAIEPGATTGGCGGVNTVKL